MKEADRAWRWRFGWGRREGSARHKRRCRGRSPTAAPCARRLRNPAPHAPPAVVREPPRCLCRVPSWREAQKGGGDRHLPPLSPSRLAGREGGVLYEWIELAMLPSWLSRYPTLSQPDVCNSRPKV